MSATDKTKLFDTLRDLLSDPDVTSCCQKIAQDLPDILQDLQKIEDGDDDQAEKYELDEGRMTFEKDIKSYLYEQREKNKFIIKKTKSTYLCFFDNLYYCCCCGRRSLYFS